MSLFKKSIYELVCKDAKGGKETYEMLQDYVGCIVYSKIENTPYEDDYETIFQNVFDFADSGKIKARNINEIDEIINSFLNNELSKSAII